MITIARRSAFGSTEYRFLFHTRTAYRWNGWSDIPVVKKPSVPQPMAEAVGRLCGRVNRRPAAESTNLAAAGLPLPDPLQRVDQHYDVDQQVVADQVEQENLSCGK